MQDLNSLHAQLAPRFTKRFDLNGIRDKSGHNHDGRSFRTTRQCEKAAANLGRQVTSSRDDQRTAAEAIHEVDLIPPIDGRLAQPEFETQDRHGKDNGNQPHSP